MTQFIHLSQIEASLRLFNNEIPTLNNKLSAELAPLPEQGLNNLLAAYELVDQWIANEADILSLGGSEQILELNHTVHFGPKSNWADSFSASQRALSEKHFYQKCNSGIGNLMEYVQQHRFAVPWDQAAAVYVRIMAEPQLFIEGNHRSGCLLMSYVLMRHGLPPFVLTPDNAVAFFERSAAIVKLKRRSLLMRFKQGRLRQQLAQLLRDSSDPALLLSDRG